MQRQPILLKTTFFHGKVRKSFHIFRISPQKSGFLRKVWKCLEITEKVRKLPEKYGNLKKNFITFLMFFIINKLFSAVLTNATPTYFLVNHPFPWKSREKNANLKKCIFLILKYFLF